MKILFIGGTGVISSACSELAVAQGHQLTVLNRSRTERPLPAGTIQLTADIRDITATRAALGERTYDVVVDWIAYTPQHIETDLTLFGGRTAQYVFISSASAYKKPIRAALTENMPLENPYWEYSRQKIACEDDLMRAHEMTHFPVTIVRPSHTYDRTQIPFRGRWTVMDRMLRHKPIIVHGDGTALWTITHHRDFAAGFNGLLGNMHSIGEVYHITTDEWLTWDEIAQQLGAAVGVEPEIVHVPADVISGYDPDWGDSLLGDKVHSLFFDNSKIKQAVPGFEARIPFAQGAVEIANWHAANPAARQVDEALDAMMDAMITAQRAVRPRAV